ncbi:MAG: DUF4417 domain-containing protein [Paludibacteraceae bacterium]|nr:DUF4417 domain-containing protein [Paludibacteraceae bacterium]
MKNKSLTNDDVKVRAGLKDIWNAFMAEGARFGKYDIPFCPTTARVVPNDQITWAEAVNLHRKHLNKGEYDYREPAFINWYIDDYKFDGARGIWHDYKSALNVIKHFAGAITPDFSTYQDFPEAIKIYATYRMRLYGFWLGKEGCAVINNVRWGTEETYAYCFEGVPTNSIVAIGTVGGGPRRLKDRERFEKGLLKMIEILRPHTVLVYGSSNGDCFRILEEQGIHIVSYQSKTAKDFERRRKYE